MCFFSVKKKKIKTVSYQIAQTPVTVFFPPHSQMHVILSALPRLTFTHTHHLFITTRYCVIIHRSLQTCFHLPPSQLRQHQDDARYEYDARFTEHKSRSRRTNDDDDNNDVKATVSFIRPGVCTSFAADKKKKKSKFVCPRVKRLDDTILYTFHVCVQNANARLIHVVYKRL